MTATMSDGDDDDDEVDIVEWTSALQLFESIEQRCMRHATRPH